MKKSINKIYYISFITIISVILLILGENLNFNVLLLALSTYIISLPIKKYGIFNGFYAYLAVLLIYYITSKWKLYWVIYSFFGIYPFIKFFIESTIKSLKGKLIFKYVWFNSTLFLVYMFYGNLLLLNIKNNRQFVAFFSLLFIELFFLIYDIMFTKVIKLLGR